MRSEIGMQMNLHHQEEFRIHQSPIDPRADRAVTDRTVNAIEAISTRGTLAPMTGCQQQAIGDRLPTPPTPPGR
eukprot:208134-Karenia_brevis.AAC.1